ncbi:hypothetical protein [Streptantibioticus parmotrematis]|uniref:hypothetical protein n=1 Tax=Streptantibioticus parmotrematis TaxID=2873249 RepID=UPI00207BD663|nr:hypothetical protein [Streptantibioticus parmotrematis]
MTWTDRGGTGPVSGRVSSPNDRTTAVTSSAMATSRVVTAAQVSDRRVRTARFRTQVDPEPVPHTHANGAGQ